MNDSKIVECLCAWYELRGLKNKFIKANWNLRNEISSENIERINCLGRNLLMEFCPGKTLILNEGGIKSLDIDNQKKDLTQFLNFLSSFLKAFFELNEKDQEISDGLKGVLTYGHRYEYIDADFMERMDNKKKLAYFPREFQMNTAFSKAYIINESKEIEDMDESCLYVDKQVLNKMREITEKFKVDVIEESSDENYYYFIVRRWKDIQIRLKFFKNAIEYRNDRMGIDTILYKLDDYTVGE